MADKAKKQEPEGVVTMCISGGLWFIGKLVGGNKLIAPRVFDMYEIKLFDEKNQPIIDPQTREQKTEPRIRMQPFPGAPSYCLVGSDAVRYPVLTNIGNLLSLYVRVSTKVPPPDPPEKNIDESRIVLPSGRKPGMLVPPGMEQN